jgi:integrase
MSGRLWSPTCAMGALRLRAVPYLCEHMRRSSDWSALASQTSSATRAFGPESPRRAPTGCVQSTFSRLARQAGLKPRSTRCRPRLHDARHTFASTILLGWYRAGADVEARLPLLSAYLGHATPADTYWYLSAVPELLSLMAQRRERTLAVRP